MTSAPGVYAPTVLLYFTSMEERAPLNCPTLGCRARAKSGKASKYPCQSKSLTWDLSPLRVWPPLSVKTERGLGGEVL